MSDFLSREKEFLKLNEELDKKTKSALEKKLESSRTISPRSAATGRVLGHRRASIEVDKLNLRTSSKVSAIKNSSFPRSELKRNRGAQSPPNPRLSPNSQISSRIDNASQITSRTQASSRVLSPKIENRNLISRNSEKPPIKPKMMSQTKANTVPRNSRDIVNSSRCVVKERQLFNINAKINKFERKAKMDLEHTKENFEKLKIKEKSPSRDVQSPKNLSSPKNVRNPPRSPSLSSGRQSPTSLSKRPPKVVTETYRNKNFKESPSTEALNIRLNSPTSETKGTSVRSELTGRTKRESATSSIKKPLRQLPGTSERVNRKNVSTDGLIKYLKSKLSIIEMELEDNMNELKKKSDELHSSYETQKRLELQRDQAISKNNALTEQLSKVEEKFTSVERKLKDRETEFTATTREVETLRREVRVITQANANLEKRLYRANEELENVKNHLSSMKEAERELKESTRQEKEALDRQIKTLKKQRSELLTAYKKQLYLIDNLKRQNICMEQSRMISFGEKEFTKVLEWNMQN